LAPPCFGPRSAPIAPQMQEYMSVPVPAITRAVQHVQEMAADRVVVGLDVDALARVAVAVPVGEHRTEAGEQPVGDVARAGDAVVVLLGQRAAEHRNTRAHHVHRVARRGQALQCVEHRRRQSAHALELQLVAAELGGVRQLAVDEQIGHFLEFAVLGEVEDVVAPVVQVVAAAADGAQCGVAGGDAGQSDGFLRLEAGGGCGFVAHGCLLWSWILLSAGRYRSPPSRLKSSSSLRS